MIIALDLFVSDGEGIDKEGMPGAKVVAAIARERGAALRQAWREAADRARQQRFEGTPS